MVRVILLAVRRTIDQAEANEGGAASEQVFAPTGALSTRPLLGGAKQKLIGEQRFGGGRRKMSQQRSVADSAVDGHAIRAVRPQGAVRDVAIGATLQAAAVRGAVEASEERISITPEDIRVRLRQPRVASLILFVVDSSGSMGAKKRMALVKGVMLELLLEAYQKRDRVGLIAFRRESAQVLVPPTNSVEVAERQLRVLPTGGRTPLGAGLQRASQLLEQQAQKKTMLSPLLVLVTDGRSNVGPSPAVAARAMRELQVPALVLDSEEGYVRLGKASEIAQALGAEYLRLDELTQPAVTKRIRTYLGS